MLLGDRRITSSEFFFFFFTFRIPLVARYLLLSLSILKTCRSTVGAWSSVDQFGGARATRCSKLLVNSPSAPQSWSPSSQDFASKVSDLV